MYTPVPKTCWGAQSYENDANSLSLSLTRALFLNNHIIHRFQSHRDTCAHVKTQRNRQKLAYISISRYTGHSNRKTHTYTHTHTHTYLSPLRPLITTSYKLHITITVRPPAFLTLMSTLRMHALRRRPAITATARCHSSSSSSSSSTHSCCCCCCRCCCHNSRKT